MQIFNETNRSRGGPDALIISRDGCLNFIARSSGKESQRLLPSAIYAFGWRVIGTECLNKQILINIYLPCRIQRRKLPQLYATAKVNLPFRGALKKANFYQ